MKPDGGSDRAKALLFTAIVMKHVGGRFDAGPAGANMPLPSKLSMALSWATTAACVGRGPAAPRACTNSRADSHPYAAKMSGRWLGATCLSQCRKRLTSGMLSSPPNIASGWARTEPLVWPVRKAGS